jgi:hypothetical protein
MMTVWGVPIGVQLDVGNALVGIGTILLAFVTFFITYANIRETRRIALRSSKAEAHQQLSDRRLMWSDGLREEVAELIAEILLDILETFLISSKYCRRAVPNRSSKNCVSSLIK